MDKEALIQLTGKVYKITLLFPKKEPLRYKMREIADAILEDFIKVSFSGNFKTLENNLLAYFWVLDGFFEIAKKQSWASEPDVLAIQQEYANLKARIQQEISEGPAINPSFKFPEPPDPGELNHLTGFVPQTAAAKAVNKKEKTSAKVNPRQRVILDFLKENGRVQVRQVKEIFPDVSKRTLRRDFEYMLKHGIVERLGQKNDTFYQVKTNMS